jgi:hypothetical protein
MPGEPPTIDAIHPCREDALALLTIASRMPSAAPRDVDYSGLVIQKPWGYEYQLFANEQVAIWILCIRCGYETSMHCHRKKRTSLVVLGGRVRCSTLRTSCEKQIGGGLALEEGVFHQTRCLSEGEAFVMEVETPPDKHDLVRLCDRYGRAGTGYETSATHATNLQDYSYLSLEDSNAGPHHIGKRLGGCTLSLVHLNTRRELSQLLSTPDSGIVCVLTGEHVCAPGRLIVTQGDALAAGIGREVPHDEDLLRSVDVLVVKSAFDHLSCSPLECAVPGVCTP